MSQHPITVPVSPLPPQQWKYTLSGIELTSDVFPAELFRRAHSARSPRR
jgi:hypothetical protein